MLNRLDEVFVIFIDFLLQRGKNLLDLSQDLLESGLALLAALLATLLEVKLLELAVDNTLFNFDEVEESSLVSALNNWLEALGQHRPCEDKVLCQSLSIALVAASSHCVAPPLEVLHDKELLEEGHLADYHEIDAILDILLFRDKVCRRVVLVPKLDESLLRKDIIALLNPIRVLGVFENGSFFGRCHR